MESSELQGTLGKLAVGIKVTDLDGNRISFARATGRLAAHAVSGITLGIGFAMAVFTRRRQTLHDTIAGTLVVGREWTEEEVAAAADAPPVPVWASVLVVLAVVLFGPFGIGMLAAIAIPAYQSYTIRAQIDDGLRHAEPYKAEVASAVAKNRPLNDVNFHDLDPAVPKSKYVASVRVVIGVVAIHYGASASQVIAGKELILVPGLDERQKLVWVCGHASPPQGVMMALDNYAKLTDIPDIHLPIACRGNR
jgi:Tfp pilus assembly major pilin PilA